jgi:hypothetical protein
MGYYARFRRDSSKRDLFSYSVCWHGDNLDDVYCTKLGEISDLIGLAIGDYYLCARKKRFPRTVSANPRHWLPDLFLLYFTSPESGWLKQTARGILLLLRVLTGNREAWLQLVRR